MWVNLSLRAAEIKSSINKKADGGGESCGIRKVSFFSWRRKCAEQILCRSIDVFLSSAQWICFQKMFDHFRMSNSSSDL